MKTKNESEKDMELIPRNKTVYWLHILTEHTTQDMKAMAERLSILNHQIQHFNQMSESTQNLVISELNDSMRFRNWNKKILE